MRLREILSCEKRGREADRQKGKCDTDVKVEKERESNSSIFFKTFLYFVRAYEYKSLCIQLNITFHMRTPRCVKK